MDMAFSQHTLGEKTVSLFISWEGIVQVLTTDSQTQLAAFVYGCHTYRKTLTNNIIHNLALSRWLIQIYNVVNQPCVRCGLKVLYTEMTLSILHSYTLYYAISYYEVHANKTPLLFSFWY